MSKIYFLMGKSSSGKDTLFSMLSNDNEIKLDTIVSYTTRPIREGETDGKEYNFTTNEDMEIMKEEGKIIELRSYDTIHGVWYYFTANDGQIDLENQDYLIIGTLESYNSIRSYFGDEVLFPIYIDVDDGVRLERALTREKVQNSPKYSEMCRRFLSDEKDFSKENLIYSGIKKKYQNIDLETCFNEIKFDILNELSVVA